MTNESLLHDSFLKVTNNLLNQVSILTCKVFANNGLANGNLTGIGEFTRFGGVVAE